jgi:SAM-dependent methyltransferase
VQVPWDLPDDGVDMVTALSVWTHLDEPDARYYLGEVRRVLRPAGKAILTFFVLDEAYRRSVEGRGRGTGRFHGTPGKRWVFDRPAYASRDWYTTPWARVPEDAIGVAEAGLERLLSGAGMRLAARHDGNWKEIPGLYFQDVLVLEKA